MPTTVLDTRQPGILPFCYFSVERRVSQGTGYPAYVRKWKTAMQEAYNLASKSAQQAAKKGKRQSDKRV